MKRFALAILVLAFLATSLLAYDPVIVAGVASYAGLGSDDPALPSYAFGPQIDVDYRVPIGTSVYAAGWYTGNLWFSLPLAVPTDEHLAGVLLGGSLGVVDAEAEARLTVSSPLGDNTLSATPGWRAAARAQIVPRLQARASYDGTLVYDEASDDDSISHAAHLGIAWDPSLALGLEAGFGGAVNAYSERFVVDAAGAATTQARSDLRYEATIAAKGVLGYFTLWDASLTGGHVDSNANRYLISSATLEPDAEDQTFVTLAASISTSPTETLGIGASLDARSSWYATRQALDSTGVTIGETAGVVSLDAGLTLDWTLGSRTYLSLGAQGSYAASNDAGMNGWSAAVSMTLQVKL